MGMNCKLHILQYFTTWQTTAYSFFTSFLIHEKADAAVRKYGTYLFG